MFKFVTIYRKVDEPEALEAFFSEVHLPLAEKLPGLVKTEVSRVKSKPGGESRYYLMYELYFETEATFRAALRTEVAITLFAELHRWVKAKILTWYDAECWEETRATADTPGEAALDVEVPAN